MRKPTRQEVQQRREQAIALINQKPGISRDSLAIALNLPVKDPTGRPNRVVCKLVKRLAEDGLIRAEKAGGKDAPKLYPVSHQKPQKQLFQPAKPPECKTYRVPLDELHKFTRSPEVVPQKTSPLTTIPTESFRKARRPA